jgi:hypothetical protein
LAPRLIDSPFMFESPRGLQIHRYHWDGKGFDDLRRYAINAESRQCGYQLRIPFSQKRIDKIVKDFDQDRDNTLTSVSSLRSSVRSCRSGDEDHQICGKPPEARHANQGGNGARAYSQEEVQGFADYISKSLEQDSGFKGLLPIDGLSDALFKAMHDRILLCNLASPDALDERVIAIGKKLNTISLLANITLALSTAKSLGLSIVNTGPPDILDEVPHLVPGLVWR